MTQLDENTMNTRDPQEVYAETLRNLPDRDEIVASYDDVIPNRDDTALAVQNDMTLVHGINLDLDAPMEENIKLLTMASSYVGVIPHRMDEYVNRTVTMLGCALAPIEHIDEDGVVNRWNAVLFKLEDTDANGQHIIVNGGGKQGFLFAKSVYGAFGAGDWQYPMEVRITQEARTSKDGQPRRMYRFQYLGMAHSKKGGK